MQIESAGIPTDQRIETYSTGMRMKLAIFSLLPLGRPIWLLDEPFGSLDESSSKFVDEILQKGSRSGKTIIFTSPKNAQPILPGWDIYEIRDLQLTNPRE